MPLFSRFSKDKLPDSNREKLVREQKIYEVIKKVCGKEFYAKGNTLPQFLEAVKDRIDDINRRLKLEGMEEIDEIPESVLKRIDDDWSVEYIGPDA